jgi:hypothetical protein
MQARAFEDAGQKRQRAQIADRPMGSHEVSFAHKMKGSCRVCRQGRSKTRGRIGSARRSLRSSARLQARTPNPSITPTLSTHTPKRARRTGRICRVGFRTLPYKPFLRAQTRAQGCRHAPPNPSTHPLGPAGSLNTHHRRPLERIPQGGSALTARSNRKVSIYFLGNP